MRLPKGKRITPADVAEIEKFREFLRDVKSGATEQTAYALRYGETIYDAGDIQKASNNDQPRHSRTPRSSRAHAGDRRRTRRGD